ncbi:hypothetical protein CDD83_1614 [Cordyceps sp. RAO-2017]|nr:hypothetical protein CDD83_1614 [Cordyceps sp. RAO-2017]
MGAKEERDSGGRRSCTAATSRGASSTCGTVGEESTSAPAVAAERLDAGTLRPSPAPARTATGARPSAAAAIRLPLAPAGTRWHPLAPTALSCGLPLATTTSTSTSSSTTTTTTNSLVAFFSLSPPRQHHHHHQAATPPPPAPPPAAALPPLRPPPATTPARRLLLGPSFSSVSLDLSRETCRNKNNNNNDDDNDNHSSLPFARRLVVSPSSRIRLCRLSSSLLSRPSRASF